MSGPAAATFAAIDELIGQLTEAPALELAAGRATLTVYSQPVDDPKVPAVVCEWPVIPLTLTQGCVDVTEARLDVLCIGNRLDARYTKEWLAAIVDHVLGRWAGYSSDAVSSVEPVELAELGPFNAAGVDYLAARLSFVIDPVIS